MIDNKQELENLGINLSKLRGGKTLCPKCSHLRKKKTDPCLSVDVANGRYNCHNCDFRGGIKKYTPEPKVYSVPSAKTSTNISDKMINWFFKERAITASTLNRCGVSETKEWLPQTGKEENCINFNYFRDGKLINIKYRDGRKNFKMFKDAELIFYGLDDIKNSDWCVIVEGEIDKLSFMEIGVSEVISVPNGASNSDNPNLTYLDNCIEYFDDKKMIILAMDTDEVGIKLRDELARRLGYERCFKVNFNDCKDANEYLIKYGSDLKNCILKENVKEFPIAGVITMNELWSDVKVLIEEGITHGDQIGKIAQLDKNLSFFVGQLMVLTGIPNHGKSPFMLFIMACLSVRYGWRWAIFTPEHNPLQLFAIKIMELLIGKRIQPKVGFHEKEMDMAKRFINEHFYFIKPEDEDFTLDNILAKTKSLVVKKGIKGLIIDPWNKLEHQIPNGENEHNYISKELDKIIRFSQRNAIFTSIIAHPKKMNKAKNSEMFEVPTLYDISSSSNWYNKPDLGLTFYRNFETNVSEVHIKKMKYEHQGNVSVVKVRYNNNNGRFIGAFSAWDNSNWLDQPFQAEIMIEPELQEPIKSETKINTQQTTTELF